MIGFNLSIGELEFEKVEQSSNTIYNNLKESNFSAARCTINKYLDDKLFYNNENYFLIIEGVILNKNEYCVNQLWEESIIDLYKDKGECFFEKFRGSFSGVLYDKQLNKFIVFSDHLGTKHLYYYKNEGELYISSSIKEMYSFLSKNNIDYSLSEGASYMLLTYGYMLNDNTLCNQIKRLEPGSYIVFENEQSSINSFYNFPVDFTKNITEEEAVEEIDLLFRKAIKLQFDKDLEYGYKPLVGLSGGLDSRMVTWVANQMGYKQQVNYTFSETNYLDETIAKKIAEDLKHEWIFKALDNGVFLDNIDEVNMISGGNAIYYGLSHGYSMLKYLNFKELGLVHTGQLGDVIIGSYIKNLKTPLVYKGQGMYSTKMISKLKHYKIQFNSLFELEQYILKQRGINGILMGNLTAQNYTETISPFCDIDFINFCLKLPISLRKGHNIYRKWVLKKYPEAAEYIWENTKRNLKHKEYYITYKGKSIPIRKIPQILFNKLGVLKIGTNSKFHMNPLDYWYKNNSNIRAFQDGYFLEQINKLDLYPELKSDCIKLYEKGTAIERNQVLTLLSSVKLFFN
ncbi:asparagine synthase-related protein [uncultured Tenacibaculum sp.]|uniref:asparagine synthase-related protein n=1 Tax=uncultured Tenacibaculum sp. TaxID=174713 RepID=UPI00262433C5|nr:asparagine synthase-related protein [uncultured Tenacibaculum sp.]